LGAPLLRSGGRPSGLGFSPRCRTAPSRLRRGVGRQFAPVHPPVLPGARQKKAILSTISFRANRYPQQM